MKLLVLAVLLLTLAVPAVCRAQNASAPAQPAATQTDHRLDWWRDARFGMFIHWGPVALKGTEIGWSRGKEVPTAEYDNLYTQFNPEHFDAKEWVGLAKAAGMRYIALTAKHHDGFSLWDTKVSDYSIMHGPFKRDVVKELSEECKRQGLRFCTYYSVLDWRHPDYPVGEAPGGGKKQNPDMERYVAFLKAQLKELVTNYGPLGLVWFDGHWEEPWTIERGEDLEKYVRGLQPDLIINDRVGKGHPGAAAPGDYATPEQTIGSFNRQRPWETCMTICQQWAWKPDDKLKSLSECLGALVRSAGGDGNLLFNVGPMPDGQIEARQADRLREMGAWLAKYGESIYATRGGPYMPNQYMACTTRGTAVYVHVLKWPDGALRLPALPAKIVTSTVLTGGTVRVTQTGDGVELDVPAGERDPIDTIIKLGLDRPGEMLSPVVTNIAEYFVAPDGSDTNPGSAAKPLATLAGARDAARAMRRSAGQLAGPVTVWLRGGEYRLSESFRLEKQDSGTKEAPVVYRARPGERVTLIGGVSLPWGSFKPVEDPQVLARVISPEARGHIRQIDLRAQGITRIDPVLPRGFPCPVRPAPPELFVDGKPMTLARWPNEGFVKTGPTFGPGVQPAEKAGPGVQPVFQFTHDRPKLWSSASDIWLMGYWKYDWAEESIRVTAIDGEQRRITLASPHVYGVDEGKPYYTENLLEEIDRPGEYYLDREHGNLYFYPPEGVGPGTPVQISLTDQPLVAMQDVSWTAFRDLRLEVARADGFLIKGGSHVRIGACRFRNLGNRAVVVDGGTDHAVAGCEIFDTGEGGISLSGGDRPTLKPARHAAEDNDIYRFNRRGLTYRPAVGMNGVGSRAAHNLIHDAPHSAVFFWGNDHVVEYNEIHHVLALTGDGGAVYTGRDWTFGGNIIRHNYFHDLRGVKQWENAVYIDDQASGMKIYGNIFQNCHWGMLIGGGRDNAIENNVFWGCDLALQLDARGLGWGKDQLGPTLRKNLAAMPYTKEPWAGRYPYLVNIESEEPMSPLRNVVRNNVLVKSGKIDAKLDLVARQKGTVENNLETDEDPGFVDAARGNFALRSDAKLRQLLPRFVAIPVEKIGPRREGADGNKSETK